MESAYLHLHGLQSNLAIYTLEHCANADQEGGKRAFLNEVRLHKRDGGPQDI